MTRATRDVEYTGASAQTLYLAFELGVDDWKLGFTTQLGAKPRLRVMPARDLERLRQEIVDAKTWYGCRKQRRYGVTTKRGAMASGWTVTYKEA